MTMVYDWMFYKQCTQITDIQKEFYSYLAEELIDNIYNIAGTRQASRRSRGETSVYPEEIIQWLQITECCVQGQQ